MERVVLLEDRSKRPQGLGSGVGRERERHVSHKLMQEGLRKEKVAVQRMKSMNNEPK